MDFKILFSALVTVLSVSSTNSERIKYGEICRHPQNHSDLGHNHETEIIIDHWDSPDFDFDYCDFGNGHCIDNKCQCELPDLMIYSERLSECGAPTNSFCDDQIPCLSGNVCQDNKCVCLAPTTALADGSCTGGVYDSCQSDSHCNPNFSLSCIEGICYCKNTRVSVYEPGFDSETHGGCKIRAGESCSPEGQACVANSECRPGIDQIDSTCVCIEGYIPTPGGVCQKDYDQSCASGFRECNEHRGLFCINETCQCIDSDTYYDRSTGTCLTLIGKRCGNVESPFGEMYTIGCDDNVECAPDSLTMKPLSKNICKCMIGFEPELAYGKTCIPIKEV